MGLFTKQNPNEVAAKKVAQNLGVDWPPEYWAAFKTPSTGAFRRTVLLVTDEQIVYGNKRLPLSGARAVVDASGNTAVAQGWVVKERTDSRHLFLTIESGGEGVVIQFQPDMEATARKVAAYINSKGGSPSAMPRQDPQAAPDVPDQIRKLAELRDQGILTEEEFASKKAELLTKM